MHYFYAPFLPEAGEPVALADEEAAHLFRTLRAAPGTEVGVLDGTGGMGIAVTEAKRTLRLLRKSRATPPGRTLTLACAAPRKQKLDTLLKQAVEFGCSRILLLQCARSVAQPENHERMFKLLLEGCKQSGNPFLPELRENIPLQEALRLFAKEGTAAFFGSVAPAPFPAAMSSRSAWIVGPEGGFTPDEESIMRSLGAIPLNCGPYALRLETAAVAGLALLQTLP